MTIWHHKLRWIRLGPGAQDKMEVYINRFNLLHQRLRRRQGFYKPTTVAANNQEAYLEVRPSLLRPVPTH